MIHKKTIGINESILIEGELLDIQVQNYEICAWYVTKCKNHTLTIHSIGTGQNIDTIYKQYYKTLQTPDGLVHHIFIS